MGILLSNIQLKRAGLVNAATERLGAAIERLELAVSTKQFSASETSKPETNLPGLESENNALKLQIKTTSERLDKVIQRIETVIRD